MKLATLYPTGPDSAAGRLGQGFLILKRRQELKGPSHEFTFGNSPHPRVEVPLSPGDTKISRSNGDYVVIGFFGLIPMTARGNPTQVDVEIGKPPKVEHPKPWEIHW